MRSRFHDIERDLYGTSLGLDIKTAELVSEGHKHHLYAISEVIRSGSITAAVRQGLVKSGVMYESVVNNVPFVLAGSIRDDGHCPKSLRILWRLRMPCGSFSKTLTSCL